MLLRTTSIDEVPRIHDLIRAIERGDGAPFVTPPQEVEEFFTGLEVDVANDLRVAEADGELIGYMRVVHHPAGERLERAFCLGGVHPDHRGQGVGRQLVEWALARAEEKIAATPAHLPAYALSWSQEDQPDVARLLRRFGLEVARFDDELIRPLVDLPPLRSTPGITIRPWLDGDQSATSEGTRLAYNASFADHWGSSPRSADSWNALLTEYGTRLDLSFVAVDDATGQIVGYSLNDHWPEDQELHGRREGWIGSLGTLREYRKRGIASALIVASFHRFVEAGLDTAMLGVDTENPSGAYGLYTSLGFTQLRRNVTYRRTLRDGTT